jgi:hypothetical protein
MMNRLEHQNILFYTVAVIAICAGLFMWVSQGKDTNNDVNAGVSVVNEIQAAVKQLEADHDGQDALLQCLVNLFIEQEQISRVDVDQCVIETSVPTPTQTGGGTEPSSQGDTSVQSAGSLDSPNHDTPSPTPSLPENPQSPTPEEPDNDGIIVDLPLLPELHIPSPF